MTSERSRLLQLAILMASFVVPTLVLAKTRDMDELLQILPPAIVTLFMAWSNRTGKTNEPASD